MRIYLAAPTGMYMGEHTKCAAGGSAVTHRTLLSFLPQFKTSDPLQIALDRAAEPVDYCVDSGAHVWLSNFFKKHESPPLQKAEDFVRLFISAIEALPRMPTYVVELDLQQIYGDDTIKAWRRDLWAPFEQRTGVRVCYVWHPADDLSGWYSMLRNDSMRYLGIGGARDIPLSQTAHLAASAYQAGKPAHCFAGVNVRWILAAPFYSVDSTSWAVGGQAFGSAAVFDPTTGSLKRYKIGNAQVRSDVKKAEFGLLQTGIHASDVIDRGRERNKKNYARYYAKSAEPYKQLEEWHTARWLHKGIDWQKRLQESGFGVANSAGGHLKAAGV